VEAVTNGKLWSMGRDVYQSIKVAYRKHVEKSKERAICSVPMLRGLAPERKSQLADVMAVEEFREGEYILRQNEIGFKFYIIDQGNVLVLVDGSLVAERGQGSYFGERALIHGEARSADIIASSFTTVFSIEQGHFQQFYSSLQHAWSFSVLRDADVFSSLSDSQILKVAAEMQQVTFPPGATLFESGDPGDCFYIIEKGQCRIVSPDDKLLTTCKRGQCFGEMALLTNQPRGASALAVDELVLLKGDISTFQKYLGDLKDLNIMWKMEALQKIPLFANISREELSSICGCFTERIFKPGEVVFREGDEGDSFFIIESGHISVIKTSASTRDRQKEVAQLGPGNCFGERSLLSRDPRTATAKAIGDVRENTMAVCR